MLPPREYMKILLEINLKIYFCCDEMVLSVQVLYVKITEVIVCNKSVYYLQAEINERMENEWIFEC